MLSNKKRFFKIGIVVLIVAIVVALLVVASNTSTEREDISGPEKILREILAPFQNGASLVSEKFQAIPDYFGGIAKLREENQLLQNQLNDLQDQLVSVEEITAENTRLRELVNYANEINAEWEYQTTSVINRSQSSWYSTMIINGGEDVGFAIGQPVVANGGLVGRIINVTAHTSEVLMILDQEGAVGVMIQETRTVGVVEGVGTNSADLQMIHIPYDSNIEKYDTIITSGLGDNYPKGLLVGYIREIEMESGGLMMKAEVQSFVDFEKLEEVMVLTPRTAAAQ